jgi:hypothetical protein
MVMTSERLPMEVTPVGEGATTVGYTAGLEHADKLTPTKSITHHVNRFNCLIFSSNAAVRVIRFWILDCHA